MRHSYNYQTTAIEIILYTKVEIEGKGNRLIPLLILGLFTWRDEDLEPGIYEDPKADLPGAICFLSVLQRVVLIPSARIFIAEK